SAPAACQPPPTRKTHETWFSIRPQRTWPEILLVLEADAPRVDKAHGGNLAGTRRKPTLISVRKRTAFVQFSSQLRIEILRVQMSYCLCTDKRRTRGGGPMICRPYHGNAYQDAPVSAFQEIPHRLAGGARAHRRHVVPAGHDCGGAMG